MKKTWKNNYDRPISLADAKKMIENTNLSWMKSLIPFLWIFGTRINEALKMRVRDFDINENKLIARIPYSKRNDKKNRRHNISASRETPLLDRVIRRIREIENTAGREKIWKKSYWSVWYNMKNNVPLIGTDVDKNWITPHMFRHTRATKLAEREGVMALELQEFHGWKSINTAQSYLEEAGRRAAQLEDKIGD